MRILAIALLTVLIAAGCGSGGAVESVPTFSDKVAAAQALCPLMWDTDKAIGEAFNRASLAMKDLPDPQQRRDRWARALDEMERIDEDLASRIQEIDLPVLSMAKTQIETGIEQSKAEIEDIRRLFTDTPEIDEQRHQARTQQVVVRVEKVIDVLKPEMSAYDDPEIIEAFRTVPACQHGVKDVDDGIGRANG